MTTTFFTKKAATPNTTFTPCEVFVGSKRKYGLIDGDGDLVGLSERDTPYCLDTINDIHKAANRGIRNNAPYNGFSVTKGFNGAYFLVEAQDVNVEDFERENDFVIRSQKLAKEAADLYERISGKKLDYCSGSVIDGECHTVTPNYTALIN